MGLDVSISSWTSSCCEDGLDGLDGLVSAVVEVGDDLDFFRDLVLVLRLDG